MAQLRLPDKVKLISTTAGKGSIEVEQLDITRCKTDAIVGNLSIDAVRLSLIELAGCEIQTLFNVESHTNPTSPVLITPPGDLLSQMIIFVKWVPTNEAIVLQKLTIDFIWTVFQTLIPYNFTSIAFPTLGFEHFACPMELLIRTLVKEMKHQLKKIDVPWTVKFLVQPNQSDLYQQICKEILIVEPDPSSFNAQVPPTWEKFAGDQKRVIVPPTSEEHRSVLATFDQPMRGSYTQIIRIERIQNERWYMQYLAHRQDFLTRLKMDTEQRLFHGCPEQAASSIIEGCFNRSYAGINGIALGAGVYFSSSATYSHGYTRPNASGERCMFIARILVGKTTGGNRTMKTPPPGFDSTSSGGAFVTYHDAQAYAEYLITYK